MNKQELIERIKGLKNLFGNKAEYIEIDAAIKLIEQLNEPQKTVVPQFVADWIERERKSGGDLEDLFDDIVCEQKHLEWFREEENMNLVARAWLDGYTVEKEPKYTVKIKGKIGESLLVYGWGIKRYFFARTYNNSSKRGEHTRKELEEDGFGWVFDCPGIEIEEVEE